MSKLVHNTPPRPAIVNSNGHKPAQEREVEAAIYTPQEVSVYGIDAIRAAKDNVGRGLALPIAEISDYFAPLMPGQTCAILGQTSHYKSGFMHFWEQGAAEQLKRQGRDGEMIVHVSTEECVEEQAFLEFARTTGEDAGKLARGEVQDWSGLMKAAVHVGTIPIYRIGDSLARADDLPMLYLSNMVRAIDVLIKREKRKPAAIFFDYLQAFPIDPEVRTQVLDKQRRLQVRQDIYRIRNAALHFDCPVVIGVQAKQILTGANPPIMLPGVYDGEESSSIAQRVDRLISLWMPKQTNRVGSRIDANGYSFTVDENQLWVKICKQRGGLPAGKSWPCRINFRTNTIALETRVTL